MRDRTTRLRAVCGHAALAGLASCLGAASAAAQVQTGPFSPLPPPPGIATGVQPLTGTSLQAGDLRSQVEQALGLTPPAPAPGTPAFTVAPWISVSLGYTDNAQGSSRGQGSDVFTLIQPGIAVTGQTSRITGNLFYAPTATIYASNSSQDYVGQNLSASGQVELIPETLFLDVRGYMNDIARFGTSAPGSVVNLSGSQQTLATSFLASPRFVHRFGTFGTLQLGYSFGYTTTSDQSGGTPAPTSVLAGQTGNSHVLTNQEYATFVTGPDFPRAQSTVTLEADQSDGTGVLSGAYQNLASYQLVYAATRFLYPTVGVGYEDIHYGGFPPTRINDVTWKVALQLVGHDTDQIIIGYQHQQGFSSPFVSASYMPTARTRVVASYSEGLTTGDLELQNALAQSTTSSVGNLINSSGAPVLPASNFFGLNTNSLYRLKRLSITGLMQFNYDTFSASVVREQRDVVATAGPMAVAQAASTSGVYGALTWGHQLSRAMQSIVYFQYGVNNNNGSFVGGLNNGSQNLLAASAALNYVFSETLTGSLQYTFSDTTSSGAARGYTSNLVLATIRKGF